MQIPDRRIAESGLQESNPAQGVIELHPTTHRERKYSIEELVSFIDSTFGFRHADRHGPVCVFTPSLSIPMMN